MSAKQYIALKAIQVVDAEGVRQSIEPRVEGKVSGLFEHDFSAKDERRLIRLGAIREPEGTEEHERPTAVETMTDTRDGAGGNAGNQTPSEKDGLDDLKVPELVALAGTEKVNLGEATKKADIIAVIRKARANPTADGLDDLKVEDLTALADREVIDLGEATEKTDIIAAIRKARAAEAGGQ